MSDLSRLCVSAENLAALRDQLDDEKTRRDLLITAAVESGYSYRTVAQAAGLRGQSHVVRIVGDMLARRQIDAIPDTRPAA
jgi:hypothetical protein